ncbi:glycosyltransferase family 2 protein [Candidatus Woesearchaeota archaeon]|nr:glycosyltransferase family 2 protein [Candidatus Woesearchaeota archaeon]
MKSKVSFVILSYNDGEMAINAIKSIKKLRTRHKFDIFVVDNGSNDNSAKSVRNAFDDVKVIELGKNIGTAAYDAAIKKSKSEYIFFTGCDIEAKGDMLDKLVAFLGKNKDVILAAPKYINFYNKNKIDTGGTWLSRSFYSGTFKDNTLGDKNIEIPYIGAGLIRKELIEKFGYLNDNDYFFYGEDVDLGLRIRLLGFKIYYIPSSIVYHMGSMSRKIYKPYYLTFLMERNLLTTFFKILSIGNIFLLMPYVLLMRIVAIARDLITLKFMNAFARLFAVLWIAFNFSSINKKRKKLQKMRKADDMTLFRIFSERYLFR